MKKISTVYSLVFVIHVFMYGNCAYAGFGFLKPLLKPIVEMCGKKVFSGVVVSTIVSPFLFKQLCAVLQRYDYQKQNVIALNRIETELGLLHNEVQRLNTQLCQQQNALQLLQTSLQEICESTEYHTEVLNAVHEKVFPMATHVMNINHGATGISREQCRLLVAIGNLMKELSNQQRGAQTETKMLQQDTNSFSE